MPRDYKSSPPRILLVEDDNDLAASIANCLTFEGYLVTIAANGKAALQACVNKGFDIVSTDIKLPGWDGLTFLQFLRKSPQKDIPAVVISGQLNQECVRKLIDLEIRKIYTKPFNMQDYIASINNILSFTPATLNGARQPQNEGPSEFEDEFEV